MDNQATQYPEADQIKKEEPLTGTAVLQLSIDDKDLAPLVKKRIDEAERFFKNELKLPERRKLNEDFWVGKHFDETKFLEYQIPYKDNLIWQDFETRIAIVASRMPDIIVTPTDETEEKKEAAKNLEKGLNLKVKSDAAKRMVKDGLRHHGLKFIAAIKVRWDPNKGKDGDFIFELVRPELMGMDHTATIPHDGFTADNMEIIYEWIEEPLGVVLARFPDKKDELFRNLRIIKGTPRQMVSKVRYLEVWFTWYDENGKQQEGVCWKYNELILGKSKNPYWDFEGYETTNGELNEFGNPKIDTLYRNHFDRPRKPYIFFSYQNLGRSPIDDTTAVEQAIPLQKITNKRGRQITELADRSVPKLAFSGFYIDKEQARRVTNDPDEHIWLERADDVNRAVKYIPSAPPAPILYQDLVGNRMQIDAKFATHATTRGETLPQESGISKQITREGDLVISDDQAEIMVERIIYEMANWATQMMKVMYRTPHFMKDLGPDGELVQVTLQRDYIEDGVAVNVKASPVDKNQRRFNAQNDARMKLSDPLSYYEDMDYPNPRERTKRLLRILSGDLQGYAADIGLDITPSLPTTEVPTGEETPPTEEVV